MKFGVIIFPGSNCDHDAHWTAQHVAKQPATFLWHESSDLQNCEVIIVPGGFSYGDYLRTGAIAKFSPVMESVRKFAAGGGLVLGICNGFQILCESGLLPGALMRNVGLKYVCKPVHVRVENNVAYNNVGHCYFLEDGVEHGVHELVSDARRKEHDALAWLHLRVSRAHPPLRRDVLPFDARAARGVIA